METGIVLKIVFVLGGLGGLILTAHLFLAGALGLSEKLNIPEIIVGGVVVALGTSAPELAINIVASLEGHGDIVISNLVGSNIVNVCLGVGLAALLVSFTKPGKGYLCYIVLGLAAACIVALVGTLTQRADHTSTIPVYVSTAMLVVFAGFMVWSLRRGDNDEDGEDGEDGGEEAPKVPGSIPVAVICLLAGCAGMAFAADFTVDNAVELAVLLAFPPAVIGATLIAAGGSLPEIFSCIMAARLGRHGIVVGNIAGSQIFNLLGVLGVSGLVSRIDFSSALIVDALILVAVTVLWLGMMTAAVPRLVMASALILSYTGYAAYLAGSV